MTKGFVTKGRFVCHKNYNKGKLELPERVIDAAIRETLPMLVASVCLFEGFLKLDIGSNRLINIVSSVTFGIYLIHDNQLFRELMWKTGVRDTLFTKCLNFPNVESVKHFVPLSICAIIAVFVICGLIEAVRLYLIEPLYIKSFFKWGKQIDDKVDEYIKKEGIAS